MRSLISLVTPLYQSIPAIAVVAFSVTSLNAHAEDKNTGEQEGGVVFGLWTPFAPPQNPVTREAGAWKDSFLGRAAFKRQHNFMWHLPYSRRGRG